jgi:hypothetical protein
MSAPVTQAVALAFWLGAAALLAAVVAPAAFAVLPSRSLAGDVVGRVLPVVFWSGMVVGVVVAAIEWRSAAPSRARVVSAAVVALACAASQLYFGSRIARLRAEIGGPVDALVPGDPQRALFGRLHGLSVLGLGLAMIAAGVALVLALRAVRR